MAHALDLESGTVLQDETGTLWVCAALNELLN